MFITWLELLGPGNQEAAVRFVITQRIKKDTMSKSNEAKKWEPKKREKRRV